MAYLAGTSAVKLVPIRIRIIELQSCEYCIFFFLSIYYTNGVARWLLGPHHTLPCVSIKYSCLPYISLRCNYNPLKNSQAVNKKKSAAFKSLGEKSCEVNSGDQEMAATMLMLINFNNAHSHFLNFFALTSLQPFLGHHL